MTARICADSDRW